MDDILSNNHLLIVTWQHHAIIYHLIPEKGLMVAHVKNTNVLHPPLYKQLAALPPLILWVIAFTGMPEWLQQLHIQHLHLRLRMARKRHDMLLLALMQHLVSWWSSDHCWHIARSLPNMTITRSSPVSCFVVHQSATGCSGQWWPNWKLWHHWRLSVRYIFNVTAPVGQAKGF